MKDEKINEFIVTARKLYGDGFVPLHRPVFEGNERQYLIDCVDSNFVSSVGPKVDEFQSLVANFVGSKYAVATVNGTSALHVALLLSGVTSGDEVITQALTFVATCNAIKYINATPVFIDVDRDTLGLSPAALRLFLQKNAIRRKEGTFNKNTGAKISSCVPMHTFGFPCRLVEIAEVCADWGITLVEDAAEALGSYCSNRHAGTIGTFGTLSFNGNKLITTGGGGMIITDNEDLAQRAKHITTTSKVQHTYEFYHDEIGYNYRMPNVNAALGCAQIENLPTMLQRKAEIASAWQSLCARLDTNFVVARKGDLANHWLNTILLNSRSERDHFLQVTNENGVMTRPIWTIMPKLPMYNKCETDGLENSSWLEDRVVNIPSSVPSLHDTLWVE